MYRVPAPPRRRRAAHSKAEQQETQLRLARLERLLLVHGIDPNATDDDTLATGSLTACSRIDDKNGSSASEEPELEASIDNLPLRTARPVPNTQNSTSDRAVCVNASATASKPRISTSTSDSAATVNRQRPARLVVDNGRSKLIDNTLWSTLGDELHEDREAFPDSDEDSSQAANTDCEFLLGATPSTRQAYSLHPPTEQIFKLWQLFLEHVNPITKIIHYPSMQKTLHAAAFDIERLPRGLEALMFSIYRLAVQSLDDAECRSHFGQPRDLLLERYRLGCERSLARAKFLSTSELMVLQAFLFYLVSWSSTTGRTPGLTFVKLGGQRIYKARSLWALVGVASRIAQGMGLHSDGEHHDLSPFDTEMRRRLWWQIQLLDVRSAELSGAVRLGGRDWWDVQLPSNCNDAEIYPEMTTKPANHDRATEMTCCLLRYDFRNRLREMVPAKHNVDASLDSLWYGQAGVPMEEKDKTIDQIEKQIAEKFLQYCDPAVPIQLYCKIVGKIAIAGLRMMVHRPALWRDPQGSEAEKRLLWSLSTEILEADCMIHSSPILQRFMWHVQYHFHWHSIVFLLSDLMTNRTGDQADEAWLLMEKVFSRHTDLINEMFNTLHVALRRLCLKSYNAREKAFERQGISAPKTPGFILQLRKNESSTSPSRDKGMRPSVTAAQGVDLHVGSPTQVAVSTKDASGLDTDLADSWMDYMTVDWTQWDNLLQFKYTA